MGDPSVPSQSRLPHNSQYASNTVAPPFLNEDAVPLIPDESPSLTEYNGDTAFPFTRPAVPVKVKSYHESLSSHLTQILRSNLSNLPLAVPPPVSIPQPNLNPSTITTPPPPNHDPSLNPTNLSSLILSLPPTSLRSRMYTDLKALSERDKEHLRAWRLEGWGRYIGGVGEGFKLGRGMSEKAVGKQRVKMVVDEGKGGGLVMGEEIEQLGRASLAVEIIPNSALPGETLPPTIGQKRKRRYTEPPSLLERRRRSKLLKLNEGDIAEGSALDEIEAVQVGRLGMPELSGGRRGLEDEGERGRTPTREGFSVGSAGAVEETGSEGGPSRFRARTRPVSADSMQPSSSNSQDPSPRLSGAKSSTSVPRLTTGSGSGSGDVDDGSRGIEPILTPGLAFVPAPLPEIDGGSMQVDRYADERALAERAEAAERQIGEAEKQKVNTAGVEKWRRPMFTLQQPPSGRTPLTRRSSGMVEPNLGLSARLQGLTAIQSETVAAAIIQSKLDSMGGEGGHVEFAVPIPPIQTSGSISHLSHLDMASLTAASLGCGSSRGVGHDGLTGSSGLGLLEDGTVTRRASEDDHVAVEADPAEDEQEKDKKGKGREVTFEEGVKLAQNRPFTLWRAPKSGMISPPSFAATGELLMAMEGNSASAKPLVTPLRPPALARAGSSAFNTEMRLGLGSLGGTPLGAEGEGGTPMDVAWERWLSEEDPVAKSAEGQGGS